MSAKTIGWAVLIVASLTTLPIASLADVAYGMLQIDISAPPHGRLRGFRRLARAYRADRLMRRAERLMEGVEQAIKHADRNAAERDLAEATCLLNEVKRLFGKGGVPA